MIPELKDTTDFLFETLLLHGGWGKLVHKLQISCEVKYAPIVQMGAGNGFCGKGGRDAGVAGVVCVQLETLRQSSLLYPLVGHCVLAAAAEVDALLELEDVEFTE